jgi:autotransporter-associated beta strand protein
MNMMMKGMTIWMLLAGCFGASTAAAVDGVWSNPAGGSWSTAGNWDGNAIAAGAGASATFSSALSGPVVVDGAYTLGMLIASPFTTVLNGDTMARVVSLDNNASPSEISVAGGGLLVTGFKIDAKNKRVVKTGGGVWAVSNGLEMCTGFLIQEGAVVLENTVGGDGLNLGSNTLELKAGTSLKYNGENLINNSAVLQVNSGAVVDMNGKTDNIGGFTGGGVLTNFTRNLNCWLQNRTLTFSGTIYGTFGGFFDLYSPGTFVLGASNALEQVGVYVNKADTVLGFAPGIPTFQVGWFENNNPVTLEAQDGKPVQLSLGTAAKTSTIKTGLNGRGGLSTLGTASVVVWADSSYTGPTVVGGGSLTLGDGANYNGAITNSSKFTVLSGKNLGFNNKDEMVYPNSITGLGNVNKDTATNLTLASLDMEGGQLNVNNGTAFISGGNSSNLTVRVDKGRGLVVTGGDFMNSTLSVVNEGALTGSAYMTLNNGSATNMVYNNNALLSTLNVAGGNWHFTTGIGDSKTTFMYTQSGGKADFYTGKGMGVTNRVFAYVSGGELRIRGAAAGDHPRGLGLQVSGDGEVKTEATQRLSSDGWSHHLMLTNNAWVNADIIQLMSKGGTGSMTRVSLDGGVLAFNGLNNEPTNSDPTNTTSFFFNGGILRSKSNATTGENPLYSSFKVLSGGAIFDVTAENYTFYPTLYSGIVDGEDGGLLKTGYGRLDITNAMQYSGKTRVWGGMLRTLSTSERPLGSNSLHIGHGELRVQSSSSGSANLVQKLADASTEQKLSFGGGAARLSLDNPATGKLTLEIGNAAAAADTALERLDRGVLMVAPFGGLGAANFGVNESVLFKGGLSAINNMVAPYLLGVTWGGSGWFGGSFLKDDPVKGLVEATYTTGLGGGATSLASLAADTSTSSAHVHALRLIGADLTINSGETLTLGDGVNPAGLIMNRDSAGRSALLGGTLDFQGSEGIIYVDNYASVGHTISSTITGANGLTITGYGNTEILNLDAPAGNTYLGNTHILNGRVTLAHKQGFSSGDLYIQGDDWVGGCFLFDFADTVTNPMHISGIGSPLLEAHGAVTFINTSEGVINAPVELMRDARVGANGATSKGRFAQPISGMGDLEINIPRTDRAPGTIVFGAENNYRGQTIINQGRLQIVDGGTLGIGTVENKGVLEFNTSSSQTVTNRVRGTGVIRKTGSGALTLSGKVECDIEVAEGSVVMASSALLPGASLSGIMDVNGKTVVINELNGSGTITNSSATAATLLLDIGVGVESVFWGSVHDGGNGLALNKEGAGTCVLSGSSSYQGMTTVTEGTLKLASTFDQVPYKGEIAYQLDASAPETLALSGSNVTAWADSSGNNNNFVQAVGTTYNQYPVYVADALNGKGAVRFEGNWNRLYATNSAVAQTVIILNNKTGHMNLSGIWGKTLNDFGIRALSNSSWQDSNNNDFAYGGSFYVDGIKTVAYTQGTPHILSATAPVPQSMIGAIGDYWADVTNHRSYIGDIGEVLVYKTALDNAKRERVEKYLEEKWFGAATTVLTNVLPQTTALVVKQKGVLDLAGSVQTVASLSGDGAIVSSGAGVAELTVGSSGLDTIFNGSMSGLGRFFKAGSGLLTLTGVSTYTGETVVSGGTLRLSGGADRLSPSSSVTVEAGAFFDVNYLSQTLAGIGGSGTVMDCNGLTVTGAVAPGKVGLIGTLTFAGSPVLTGTYSFTAGAGSADLVVVQGSVNLGSLVLDIEAPEALAGLSYTILQCSGNLTGIFESTNLPRSWIVGYDYATGTVTLNHQLGTMIMFK